MPLYTLIVIDNSGIGQAAAIIFFKEETTGNIQLALEIFKKVSCYSFYSIANDFLINFLYYFKSTMTSAKLK